MFDTEGPSHDSVMADQLCGVWYSDATGLPGGVMAVVAASGRTILGDSGFRAAAARIEAVALPLSVRLNPVAALRARSILANSYPRVRL